MRGTKKSNDEELYRAYAFKEERIKEGLFMEEKIRVLTDLTNKHEMEIAVIKQGQAVMEKQLDKLITIQEAQALTLGSLKTTLSNAAWIFGTAAIMVPVLTQIIMKTFKG